MTNLFKDMADRLAITIRVEQIVKGEYENVRECPFYSERVGMEMALKTLGIEFEYEFNADYEVSAVVIMGNRAKI